MVKQCPSWGDPAQVPHSIPRSPHWRFRTSLSLLSHLSVAGKGWLNRCMKNTSAYSCITVQNGFSFFALRSDEDYTNWTGTTSLGTCAIWKGVHASFPLHVFHSCAFPVSPCRPSRLYRWKPPWPDGPLGFPAPGDEWLSEPSTPSLCLHFLPKKGEHMRAGIFVFSHGGPPPGHRCWPGHGSHTHFLSDLLPLIRRTPSTLIWFLPVTLKLIG